MPFLAACPFCRRRIQAPDTALGQSVACKKCHNYFTLAPADDMPPAEASPRDAQQYLAKSQMNAAAGPAAAAATPAAAPAKSSGAHVDTVQHTAMAKMPRLLQTMLPPPEEELASDEINPVHLGPIVLGVIALLCVAFGWLAWLPIPLAGAGILVGVVAWLTSPIESHRDGVLVLL